MIIVSVYKSSYTGNFLAIVFLSDESINGGKCSNCCNSAADDFTCQKPELDVWIFKVTGQWRLAKSHLKMLPTSRVSSSYSGSKTPLLVVAVVVPIDLKC